MVQYIHISLRVQSHLTIKAPEWRHWRRSTAFIRTVFAPYLCASFANFKQVIVCTISKQNPFFHLILQLRKFVFWYLKQKVEQEWTA